MKHEWHRMISIVAVLIAVSATAAYAQHLYDPWVSRRATETTIVVCPNDLSSAVEFPPGCMSMGMMSPDSLYCQFEWLPMDSLGYPHDSTFLGWHRLQLGSDSMHFTYMGYGMGPGNGMMQFMRGLRMIMYWDSTRADSAHHGWRPTGVRTWNGTGWTTITGAVLRGNTATFTTPQLSTAIAIVGQAPVVAGIASGGVTPGSFSLEQNYPNPFNPTTQIRFTLPAAEHVVLKIYNVLGSQVAAPIRGDLMQAGEHEVEFDASNLASGVYYYTLGAGRYTATKKMVVLR